MVTQEQIWQWLESVSDPEVPVLSILDLGIVRDVLVSEARRAEIKITPTYSGCPAMGAISLAIKMELLSRGLEEVVVTEVLSPAWTTDWMTETGKQKLREYGITPPQYRSDAQPMEHVVPCPICQSTDTRLISQFGSTSCKALYQCIECLEPFDYFKCH